MNLKKILLSIIGIIIIALLIFAVTAKNIQTDKNPDTKQIVATNFACYDFIRAVLGETNRFKLTYLIGPGKDTHSYEPTAKDLILIQNALMFVYIGGGMEEWADKVIQTLDKKNSANKQLICISDYVDTIEEEHIDGVETNHHHSDDESCDESCHTHEHEQHHNRHKRTAFEEHIWTSPANAVKMVNALCSAICKLDESDSQTYQQNAQNYINQINDVDNQIKNIVDNKVRNRLVFADKMPMQYFIDYYHLEVSAAFSGCSTETEPSAKTIAYLQDRVKSEKIPVLLYIELNDGRVAKTIAREVGNGCTALQIQTLHNVSLADFNNGETWVSLMSRNIDVLQKALQ